MNALNIHETTTVKDPFSRVFVEIDNDILPLIEKLWEDHICTFFSCQGTTGWTPQRWHDYREEPDEHLAYVMMEGDWRTIALAGHIMAALSDASDTMFRVNLDQFPQNYPFDPKVRGMNRLVWRFLNRDIEKITNLIC